MSYLRIEIENKFVLFLSDLNNICRNKDSRMSIGKKKRVFALILDFSRKRNN